MCHHFRLSVKLYTPGFDPLPSGDFYPADLVTVVRLADDGSRETVAMEWGLLPSWWKPTRKKTSRKGFQRKCFNARAETIHDKPAFSEPFKHRRCLVLATEFFERGFYFSLPGGKPFAFAGIWEHWESGSESVLSCTFATITPNAEVASVGHHRMPVILSSDEQYDLWMDSEVVERRPLETLLQPAADGTLGV